MKQTKIVYTLEKLGYIVFLTIQWETNQSKSYTGIHKAQLLHIWNKRNESFKICFVMLAPSYPVNHNL